MKMRSLRPTGLVRPLAVSAQSLFWAWALQGLLALFLAWWLLQRGVWAALVEGDPSRISLVITVLALVLTLWCGRRAWVLQAQAAAGGQGAWAQGFAQQRAAGLADASALLSERTHGPHETAWWFAAAAIKLGLLGTVVGFIVMATQLGQSRVFELAEVQLLLKQMTSGMAIALYTTLAGLVANLWLGLQLLLLDRLADKVAADILAGDIVGLQAAPAQVG
jgi:hypothetical protein